jgi:transposase
MVRRYGRAPRGQRLVCKVPFGAWTTLTFIAALRHDRITAPLLLQGAMNGQIFRAYVEQMLAPTLKPGDVVIMDNVRVHKVAGVSEAIEARAATVPSFPAYSPDLNPIELAFSKLKARLRAATARSTPRLLTAVRAALTRVARQSGWWPYCLIQECSRAGRALPHQNAPGATSACQSIIRSPAPFAA